MTPGRETSEYRAARRATIQGEIVGALGFVIAVAGGVLDRMLLAGVGGLIVAVGAFLIASAVRHYAHSRGMVKSPTPQTNVSVGPRRF